MLDDITEKKTLDADGGKGDEKIDDHGQYRRGVNWHVGHDCEDEQNLEKQGAADLRDDYFRPYEPTVEQTVNHIDGNKIGEVEYETIDEIMGLVTATGREEMF